MTIFLCSLVFFVLGFFAGDLFYAKRSNIVPLIKENKIVSLTLLHEIFEKELQEASKELRDCDKSNSEEFERLKTKQKSINDVVNVVKIVAEKNRIERGG